MVTSVAVMEFSTLPFEIAWRISEADYPADFLILLQKRKDKMKIEDYRIIYQKLISIRVLKLVKV